MWHLTTCNGLLWHWHIIYLPIKCLRFFFGLIYITWFSAHNLFNLCDLLLDLRTVVVLEVWIWSLYVKLRFISLLATSTETTKKYLRQWDCAFLLLNSSWTFFFVKRRIVLEFHFHFRSLKYWFYVKKFTTILNAGYNKCSPMLKSTNLLYLLENKFFPYI